VAAHYDKLARPKTSKIGVISDTAFHRFAKLGVTRRQARRATFATPRRNAAEERRSATRH